MEDTMKACRRLAARVALAVVVTLSAAPAGRAAELTSKEEALWSRLRDRIEAVDRSLDGVLGVSLRDLRTGSTIEIRPDERFPLASSIKLAVLYELYRQAEEGRIDLAEVTRPPLPRVEGGGVLQVLGDKVSLTWRDLAVLMMGWSDNEATNVLIGKVGMAAVNRRLERELDLEDVRLRRRMMDLEAARRGDENVGTPAQMRRLVEAVYEGRGLSPARIKDIRAVAATPKTSTFREPLPEGLPIMDKPGELEAVRCVTAVVDLPGRPYSVSIDTTYLRKEADGEAAIRELSAAIFFTFDRLARSSDLGRIISER